MSGKEANLLSKDDMWDDSELIKMYDESVKGNFDSKRKTTSDEKKPEWKVNDICMAPFEDLWYQATIISIQPNSKTAKVHFLEYDDEVTVEIDSLYKEDEVEYQNEIEEEEPDAITVKSQFSRKQLNIPVPNMVPPPPQLLNPITNEKEITSNLMISWYMNGYHTGYYQAMKDFQSKAAAGSLSSKKH
jgi:survival motor neuron protein|uniref:Tudor domain-containing protein n=1 Tax=Panagrolaimus sp. PS1159 TaxID=55785 RepID=A0AC35GGD2_9BILA